MKKDDCMVCEEKLNKGADNALFYCEKCRENKETESRLKEVIGLNIKL